MLRTTKEACRRIEAQAEERAAHTVEEAGAQAEELVAAAEAHAAAQAAEGEAAVAAQRDEAKHLLDEAARSRDEAARDRDAASAALVRSRKLLAAAEHQLAKSIDHAVELRAALEALRSEADAVEGEPATVDASTAQGAGAEQVIDLTEHPVDPPAELDGSLRDAVARAVDEASNPQDPAT